MLVAFNEVFVEKETKLSILIRYLIAFCVAGFLFLSVLMIKGFFTDNAKDNMQTLIDAFFASGVLMIMFYGLLFVSSEGAFLGIGFALGRAIKMLIPFSKKPIENYQQYRDRKAKVKTGENRDVCVLVVGLIFFITSMILLCFWYKM